MLGVDESNNVVPSCFDAGNILDRFKGRKVARWGDPTGTIFFKMEDASVASQVVLVPFGFDR